jgi:hypothetical protein
MSACERSRVRISPAAADYNLDGAEDATDEASIEYRRGGLRAHASVETVQSAVGR